MTVTEFLDQLTTHADCGLVFRLPDGSEIAPHFHVTEVGHVKRRFVDCGGTRREVESCLLQTWVADDTAHRLTAGKLAGIFGFAGEILPTWELPVEIEHETTVISQYPVRAASVEEDRLVFHLGLKHTDCLAKELCLPGVCAPEIKLVVTPDDSCCGGGGGCC